jgi:Uma2 family endonuclease
MATDPRKVLPQTGERMTVDAYFQLDNPVYSTKYEYLNGAVRLMAGGSKEHDDIAFNIRLALKQHFQSGPCFVQGSDMRVQVSEQAYFFPDVTVSCDVADRRRGNTLIRSPRIVFEVLSPSTEKFDRTEKLLAYQACPTIAEIVLVDQFAPHIEVYHREEGNVSWRRTSYTQRQEVVLENVDVRLSLDEIYQGIDFDVPLVEG